MNNFKRKLYENLSSKYKEGTYIGKKDLQDIENLLKEMEELKIEIAIKSCTKSGSNDWKDMDYDINDENQR